MKIFIMIVALLTVAYVPIRRYAAPSLRREIGLPFFFSAISVIFVAQFAPYPLILVMWCLIVPNIAVTSRLGVACRYVLLVPIIPSMNPALVFGGHNLGGFALVDAIGMGSIFATFKAFKRDPYPRARSWFSAEDWFVLILFVIFSIGVVRFQSLSVVLRALLYESFVLLLPYWILRRNIRTTAELQLIIACIAVIGAMISVMALYETHTGWALMDGIESRFAGDGYAAKSATVRGGSLRAAATLNNAIECGFFLMLALLATISARPFFRSRNVWLGTALLLLLGMLSSQSRGALLGLAVGVIIMLIARRKFFWSFIATLVGGLGGMALITLSHSVGKLGAFLGTTREPGFQDYRSTLLTRGLEEGRKYPVLGTSLASVFDRLSDLTQGEQIIDLVNTYLNIFLISGLVGLVSLVIAILFIYRNLFRVVARNKSRQTQLEAAYFAAAFTALLTSLATTSFYGRMPWFAVFLAFAARLVSQSLPRSNARSRSERMQTIYAPTSRGEAVRPIVLCAPGR